MFVCVKLPEVELLDKVCKAVCSNFARVGGAGGGGGGANLGYLKKRGGAAARGRTGRQLKKKNSLVIVRGVRLTQMEGRGGGGGRGGDECPHPPINSSLLVGNGPEGFGWVERMSRVMYVE